MSKKILSFLLVVPFFLSSCSSFFDNSTYDVRLMFGILDNIKILNLHTIYDFERAKDLALLKKDPEQIYGLPISSNYTNFIKNVKYFESLIAKDNKLNERDQKIYDFFYQIYLPTYSEYSSFLESTFDKITKETITEIEYNDLIESLNTKSEEFFYIHTSFTNFMYKEYWSTEIFDVNM